MSTNSNLTPDENAKLLPIRVVLADDHELVLKGLRGILKQEPDMDVVGSAMNGRDLLAEVRARRPDVAVIDIQLPDMTGLECLAQIRRENLPTKVLILTAFSDGESFQSALELEADGIALKTEPPAQTVAAIRQVFHGQLVFPRAARRWLVSHAQPKAEPNPQVLSEREEEVLALVSQGMTNAQIADRLVLSENTVKFHLQNIYQKLGVSNRTEAAAIYFQRQRSEIK
ncbi:response regulator transcription factor [Candidatus Amarolinea dominans]|uniref:response regulator transcription factor n=1 Tax=Candidatus Amarolinea dominans TaxID=3140696 RepID=UPI001DEF5BE8|nr:response regulator transcription factor [Anaerolineae bacterium]